MEGKRRLAAGGTISGGFWDDDAEGNGGGEEAAVRVSRVRPIAAEGARRGIARLNAETREERTE